MDDDKAAIAGNLDPKTMVMIPKVLALALLVTPLAVNSPVYIVVPQLIRLGAWLRVTLRVTLQKKD